MSDVVRPPTPAAPTDAAQRRIGYRWTIVALLFFATTINYIDRQVLGILAPTLQSELHWSETDYAAIVSWFSFAYGFSLLFAGRIMDWLGSRRGFTLAIIVWSLAAMGHAFARSVAGFSFARAALGIGEAGNFPGANKTIAEWFPKKERAFAIGIFNAGSNVGAIVAPLLVPFLVLTWGWPSAFLVTGAIGFVWLGCWLLLYHEPGQHPRISRQELEFIRSDPPEPGERMSWLGLFRYRQTWAFAIAKAMTDPVWLFYLFWLPKFLDADFGVKLTALAAPLVAIYLVADVGSVAGGWVSSTLIKHGWSVNRGRKTAMLIAACLIVPTMFAPQADSLWLAVALVSVAAAAHQWWSCNLFATVSDMFPKRAVGSVTGIGGFAGMMAAMTFQRTTGYLLETSGGNYQLIFNFLGLVYLAALLIVHLLVPRLEPVELR